ncbi:hypothetical protein Droror1_Dr00009962 [Drosera rotundifolia]
MVKPFEEAPRRMEGSSCPASRIEQSSLAYCKSAPLRESSPAQEEERSPAGPLGAAPRRVAPRRLVPSPVRLSLPGLSSSSPRPLIFSPGRLLLLDVPCDGGYGKGMAAVVGIGEGSYGGGRDWRRETQGIRWWRWPESREAAAARSMEGGGEIQ